ncbi:hypothetical protein F4779DRAFT_618640 [Xylariaceae sp. FL0662B]|nr:hypothetical protein F4779DRAFT_618640 [Xylariaceae sp. FL0662B]
MGRRALGILGSQAARVAGNRATRLPKATDAKKVCAQMLRSTRRGTRCNGSSMEQGGAFQAFLTFAYISDQASKGWKDEKELSQLQKLERSF